MSGFDDLTYGTPDGSRQDTFYRDNMRVKVTGAFYPVSTQSSKRYDICSRCKSNVTGETIYKLNNNVVCLNCFHAKN